MAKIKNYKNLLEKVGQITKQKDLDLSSGEDLSIGVMNLISIEEHLFYTAQKTKNKKYLDLLNEVRLMRTDLMKDIIKDPKGEQWCISKHLLAASMRVMEVGTKELKKGNKEKAWSLFEKSYKLYSLFWGINLNVVDVGKVENVKEVENNVNYVSENKELKGESESVFSKLGDLVQKAINCCRE
jgi:hypothetical protein